MELVIEPFDALPCVLKIFTINGKEADSDDFGSTFDHINGEKEVYGCCNMYFEPNPSAKEILHKKKIEICISKRIGLKARFNNKWYKITPITNSNKKSVKSNDSIEAIIQQFIFYNCLKNERLSA